MSLFCAILFCPQYKSVFTSNYVVFFCCLFCFKLNHFFLIECSTLRLQIIVLNIYLIITYLCKTSSEILKGLILSSQNNQEIGFYLYFVVSKWILIRKVLILLLSLNFNSMRNVCELIICMLLTYDELKYGKKFSIFDLAYQQNTNVFYLSNKRTIIIDHKKGNIVVLCWA